MALGKKFRSQLREISKAPKQRIDAMRWGVAIEAQTGESINDVIGCVCKHRIQLAEYILRTAEEAMKASPQRYRLSVSRSYYAMYHAVRAVVYFTFGGDDNEEHSKLPNHIPSDFPSHTLWQNTLKNARLKRNEADYDPYPLTDSAFKNDASAQLTQAKLLVKGAKAYLQTKGAF
jgi:uncharacterized protein (UPF0332 family)